MRRKGILMPSSHAFASRVKFLAPFVLSFSLHAAQRTKAPTLSSASKPAAASAQSNSDLKPAPSKTDTSKYAQEAVVIEDIAVKVRFESDGRGSVDYAIRERIQSESAITSEGVAPFQYESDGQTLEIKYVRVRKPDGSVVETPVDSAQDLTSEITRNAPMYTNMHEKHVAIRGLAVGGVIETRYVLTVNKPIAEGQFWSSHSFVKSVITLHEQLDIDVPADRDVKLHSPLVKPQIHEAAGRRVYTFEHATLTKPADPDKYQPIVDGAPTPDVELTSLTSWVE